MNNPNCDLISRSALLQLILERNRETCAGWRNMRGDGKSNEGGRTGWKLL